jgi:hypothetical protein
MELGVAQFRFMQPNGALGHRCIVSILEMEVVEGELQICIQNHERGLDYLNSVRRFKYNPIAHTGEELK